MRYLDRLINIELITYIMRISICVNKKDEVLFFKKYIKTQPMFKVHFELYYLDSLLNCQMILDISYTKNKFVLKNLHNLDYTQYYRTSHKNNIDMEQVLNIIKALKSNDQSWKNKYDYKNYQSDEDYLKKVNLVTEDDLSIIQEACYEADEKTLKNAFDNIKKVFFNSRKKYTKDPWNLIFILSSLSVIYSNHRLNAQSKFFASEGIVFSKRHLKKLTQNLNSCENSQDKKDIKNKIELISSDLEEMEEILSE